MHEQGSAMLIEKEVISPGIYWYTDEATGLPRKLDVTPELTKYWHEQGSAMLSAGLTVPIPCEHDFTAHPMTPRDKLLNNAGEVREYRLKGDVLWAACDIQDADVRKKLGGSIRWTSPWINSFTDGQGKRWDNVISHLALTTRPRITKQAPFASVAAALSMASPIEYDHDGLSTTTKKPFSGEAGICLSKAGRLFVGRVTKRLRPCYPMAFSLYAGGIHLADDDVPPPKKKKAGAAPDAEPPDDDFGLEEGGDLGALDGGGGGGLDAAPGAAPPPPMADPMGMPPMNPLGDAGGDIKMEEILCDLLQALGVPMPDGEHVGESDFKRHLYEAATTKIKELTGKALNPVPPAPNPSAAKPPAAAGAQPNPLIPSIQQEQQPMYMSLEEIHKLPDPMKGVALAMYAENQKLRAEMDAAKKVTDSLRDAKLKEATTQRASRVALLSRLSPRVKADLDSMLAMPSMALSMGDGGAVVDPMAQTLAVLEKGLSDMPHLLTTEATGVYEAPQPTDAGMTDEAIEKTADDFARMMGCPPEQKKAS
jgi:hypothetical protein